MEKAVFISSIERLDGIGGACDRLYFGNEFCERLIPDQATLARAAQWAGDRGLRLTLVTPFVTDAGLGAVAGLLNRFRGLDCLDEVVFNDWGVLDVLRQMKTRLTPVLGRLLNKQKRGPRILNMMGKVPDEMIAHFRRFSSDSDITSEFLRDLGIGRVELDNTLQGIVRDNRLAASLYVPYAYVSTSRYCLTAYADGPGAYFREIGPCRRQCREFHCELRHRNMPVPLLLKGNTYFFENRSLPEDLEGLGVDRMVDMPVPPM